LDALQHYELAILVGESSGGYPLHYGNIVPIRLPGSGLEVLMPTSTNRGFSSGVVVPDVQLSTTPDDLYNNRDSQLDYVLSQQ
jgi:hypothetical protein